MKQVQFRLPFDKASSFAKWAFENEIKVLLSYTKSDGFFGENIIVDAAVPENKIEAVKAEYKNYATF
jgi:hypothetical protein